MKNYILFLIVLSICPFWAGSQQYNIIRQGVCWTTPTAVDSSLTRLVYVSVSGAGPISVNYVNAGGVSVDVSSGGTFEMGYCGCCAPPVDSTAIDVLYYTDGDSILDGDTILYKNYYNHVFLSGNGDNFTGRMGNFNRPFASPWAAQDSLIGSGYSNLSFLPFQGNYTYSGVGNGNEFTMADTFTMVDLGSNTYSMLNVTGISSSPFITDRTLSGAVSTPKLINIFAPQSEFEFSNLMSIGVPVGIYNKDTRIHFRAKKFTATGSRVWGILSAAKYANIEIDSISIGGQVAIMGFYTDATTAGAYTISRDHRYKVGTLNAGSENTSDRFGLFRIHKTGVMTVIDSFSTINFSIGRVIDRNAGLFHTYIPNGNQKIVNSTINFNCENYTGIGTATNNSYMISFYTPNDTSFVQSSANIKVANATTSNGVFSTGSSSYFLNTNNLDLTRSNLVINLGRVTTTTNFRAAIEIQHVTLKDSAQIILHCDLCRFEGSAIPIRFNNCSFPAGTKFILSGTYFFNRPNEVINIVAPNDLTGLDISNAVFLNNGVAEWIEAAAPTVITGASGVWSNSPTTVNVEIQGNELWGFYGCDADYVPLQDILDAFCDSIAAIPADLNVAEDDLTANGSHVTDWLTHSLTFDYTGALGDTLVYRWPSPDGEVQGLYITDGPQEMELLMNGIVGTDYHDLVNYDLAGEIVFGNTGDTTVTQADKWFADIQNLVRGDTIRSVMAIDSDDEIKLKYVPISGRVSDTTDGSGDIVIPLGVTMGSVNFTALVGARGTTFQQAQVISNTATDITVRVLDDSGAPITGTAVVVDWMVMDY